MKIATQLLIASVTAIAFGNAQSPVTSIYQFGGSTDGGNPLGNLTISSTGVLYGVTYGGGTGSQNTDCAVGCGTVYQLTPPTGAGDWLKTTLYSFMGGTDGRLPGDGVILFKGSLYGTTVGGGADGAGTAFQLTPPKHGGSQWTEEVIYTFPTTGDGTDPMAGLLVNSSGDLFGSTFGCGAGCDGTVFELTPPSAPNGLWTENTLEAFGPTVSSSMPNGRLISDKNGNLYGVTTYGGSSLNCTNDNIVIGCGTVYELQPPTVTGGTWTYVLLHSFQGGLAQGSAVDDGAYPNSTLVFGPKGVLYGVTWGGGSGGGPGMANCGPDGCGTVFELTPPAVAGDGWTETVLYSFGRTLSDGASPNGPLIFQGTDLLGTTANGGLGYGTIYKLVSPVKRGQPWTEAQLYTFTGGTDGYYPSSGLIPDKSGAYYGVTYLGGTANCCGNWGTVYKFVPPSAMYRTPESVEEIQEERHP